MWTHFTTLKELQTIDNTFSPLTEKGQGACTCGQQSFEAGSSDVQ